MKFILLVCALLFLQACSSKEVTTPLITEDKTSSSSPEEYTKECNSCDEDKNELTDEFDNEFEDEEKNIIDPLSGYNSMMTTFNDAVIIYALNPVAEAYGYIIPEPLRIGVSNAIKNINFPVRFVNNILQGKFQNSSDELERFIINSTIGIAGLMDPAAKYKNIPAHREDFGQTLGYYGVGPGFHIVLPFLGPSNVRDSIGIIADGYVSPLINVKDIVSYKIPDNLAQTIGITTLYFINRTSLNLGEYESIKKDAIDLYPFLRDIYEQKRVSEIDE
ncbi:MAG: VacJ family lipoprotein [Epsilonproteobacteria bacterium]|nr:MAG: VacJ family lipoprotein [Campylobacterota bacterium]